MFVKTVSKMLQFHFLKENDSWNIPFSSLLWHLSCVMDALYMSLYRFARTVTWRNSRTVSQTTTRWLKRSRKRSVKSLILLFHDDVILLVVWRRPVLECLCWHFFGFSFFSNQSQPVSWALLSLAHWAHLSSTATTCRWSTRLQLWVPATIDFFPFVNVITAVLSNCH